jgi:hypothetical protein
MLEMRLEVFVFPCRPAEQNGDTIPFLAVCPEVKTSSATRTRGDRSLPARHGGFRPTPPALASALESRATSSTCSPARKIDNLFVKFDRRFVMHDLFPIVRHHAIRLSTAILAHSSSSNIVSTCPSSSKPVTSTSPHSSARNTASDG